MADITMCRDDKCPRRGTCYRFSATADNYRQSYFVTSPRQPGDICTWYWPVKEPQTTHA